SLHIAATAAVTHDLVPALDHLASSLERKAEEFADVVKSGRTHLMDATPVTLGQEFGGYAPQVRLGFERRPTPRPRPTRPPPRRPGPPTSVPPSAATPPPRPVSPPPSSPRWPAPPGCR